MSALLVGVLGVAFFGCASKAGSNDEGGETGGTAAGGAGDGAGGRPGGGTGGAAGTGEGGATPVPDVGDVCEVPTAWDVPTDENVVGDGTSDSCTESALAAALEAGGFVHFDCGDPKVISITSPIVVTKPTVLDGEGHVTLDGGGNNQILIAASNSSLSVRNLTFVGGKAPDTMEAEGIGGAVAGQWRSKVEVIGCTFKDNAASRGGGAVAVWTDSELRVTGSTFQQNQSWYGGAIYSLLSPLTVVNSVFVDNKSIIDGGLGDGGAIGTDGASADPDDDQGGAVTICGSHFENNSGKGQGGAAYIWVYPPDTVLIDRSSVIGNSIEENEGGNAIGGGMRVSNGAITVQRTTFSSNTSVKNGGALYLDCAPTCDIVNTTFFGNRSQTYGGAIFGEGAKIEQVTFAENYAGGHGGALFGKFEIHNSLFVDNESGNPWGQARNCSDTFAGSGVLQWRSESGDGGGDTCLADSVVADPKLGVLADNGGATSTMLPGSGSGALGLGAVCQLDDQRGEPRAPDGCDLGAVEVP